jgi:hypothetical protein
MEGKGREGNGREGKGRELKGRGRKEGSGPLSARVCIPSGTGRTSPASMQQTRTLYVSPSRRETALPKVRDVKKEALHV